MNEPTTEEVTPGTLIRTSRRKCNITRKELSKESGVSEPQIQQFELDKADVWDKLPEFLAICGVLARREHEVKREDSNPD